MNEHDFHEGDVVALNSNPATAMTVQEVKPDGELICVWFDDKHKKHSSSFKPSMLTILKKSNEED
jgi:uncharacterized protein YodC (DUF2158 family)